MLRELQILKVLQGTIHKRNITAAAAVATVQIVLICSAVVYLK